VTKSVDRTGDDGADHAPLDWALFRTITLCRLVPGRYSLEIHLIVQS
jgi:hypothetical protein